MAAADHFAGIDVVEKANNLEDTWLSFGGDDSVVDRAPLHLLVCSVSFLWGNFSLATVAEVVERSSKLKAQSSKFLIGCFDFSFGNITVVADRSIGV